ncbi:Smr/MutS family protein [Altericroceibacterium xinjiangense]|uniref:Smr/MutS family protein n=1 Tax=Altericroceibacterium xinjiangense TaxID=762261 RepID=UPI000F7E6867|nr:Smr/MutS family protein [Altericroceibacterium xinjiangense]
MKAPRGLTIEEAALWSQVTATVKPLRETPRPPTKAIAPSATVAPDPPKKVAPARRLVRSSPPAPPPPPRQREEPGLDSHWDRRLKGGALGPDFTLDLHGHTLDAAHRRLEHGLSQARAMDARLVLVITGKPRPADPADRGNRRGAIRAKILDWLAAGSYASDIAAIRGAHRRHGGEGALYIVLKRRR